MLDKQLEQIGKGFTFVFNGDEVEVTSVLRHPHSEEHSEVRLTKTDDYTILGSFKKGFIASYLEETEQGDLLNLDIISAGQHIVDELGLHKIKIGANAGLYEVSNKHWTHGGVKPKSLIELGKIAVDGVAKKDITLWLHNLKRFKQNG